MAPEGEPRTRVLTVEDEEDIRDLLCRILNDAGFDAEGVEDGGPAIERIEASRPDLIVLDLMMPLVEGWTVLERLRRMPKPPPVVVLTARGDHETLARGLREAIAAYVIKPFDIPVLVSTCRRALADARGESRAPSPERRRTPRRTVIVEATAHGEGDTLIGRGSIENLGAQGARVVLDSPVSPGFRFTLAIRTLDAGYPLRFDAEVRWSENREGRCAAGVCFVSSSAEAARRLAELFPPPG